MRLWPAAVPVLIMLQAINAHAADSETVCTNPKYGPPGADDTVACYSDAGCAVAQSLGADPVPDYDIASAPFALARGKIGAIITTDKKLIDAATANGAVCKP